ncbi:MAG: sugar ABC transporter permease, partial [Oscillospiraceae bacterium]|nr:sugar ABC transporter permease [Oscillospiraceae bacterium]
MKSKSLQSGASRRLRLGDRALPFFLVLPSAVFVLLFLVAPVFYAFWCSLWRCDYMNFTKFVGLDNYIGVFKNASFIRSFFLTMKISLAGFAISLALGVLFAVWIDKMRRISAYILEMIILVPWVTSMVVSALLWKWLFQDSLGLVNY